MPSNHLILSSLLLPTSIFPSIRVFSNESVLHIRWPKYWSFSFSISPSNEYPGLSSFRMDWLDLLAVQWTLKSLLQHHSSKASSLRWSAFFIVQLSHPYITTGKTIALTRRTFVGKVISVLILCLIKLNSPLSGCVVFKVTVANNAHFLEACPAEWAGTLCPLSLTSQIVIIISAQICSFTVNSGRVVSLFFFFFKQV